MRDGEPGWFYVGNGQLRYKDSDGWTEQFEDIDAPAKTVDVEPPESADGHGSGVGRAGVGSGDHWSLTRSCSSTAHLLIALLSRLMAFLWRHLKRLGRAIAGLWSRVVDGLSRVIAGLYEQPSSKVSGRSAAGRHRGP